MILRWNDVAADALRHLVEGLAVGVLVYDSAGRVLAANAAAEQLVGLPLEEMRGRAPSEVWELADESGSPVALDQPLRDAVLRLRRPDGQLRWVRASAAPVPDADGKPLQVVVSLLDVTHARLTDRERENLARSEKLRALGQLASGVAHDLNQSLGIIAGYCDVVSQGLDRAGVDLPDVRETVGMVAQAAMDGGETVKRLLMFARAHEQGDRQRVEIGVLLADVARLTAPRWRDAAQAEGRPIRLEVRAEGDLAVDGWGANLRAALTNLVLNAVDAMPGGGTIQLAARRVAGDVEVAVSDTGAGMPPEVQARVFEPFFSTKGEKGTGLGLAMVHGVVEQHEGRVHLDSQVGRGTTFRMTFPAASRPTDPAAPKPIQSSSRPRALRILAVDDEPSLRLLIPRLLGQDGHAVTVAASGEQALSLLEGQEFDLVISDLGMGPGMNGWELADHVRRRWPTVRFTLATGWGEQIDPETARERGVRAVLSKPYRLRDLKQLVATS